MPFEAKHRFARISPRKARLIMDLVRGRDVDDAMSILKFSKQRASVMVEKVIRSAVANATDPEQNPATPRNTLYVASAWADPGPIIKRFQPKDRGKAYPINKRTSHLVIAIDERGEGEVAPQQNLVGRRPGKAR
ncbi:MAG TPA: 50S ribosomal protein L22 [Tepidisphaeraceae bacterium]|jgi:large subunit ribosomal protein L22|nr:50S ribosomal protein L22 [Tepidisphaeraceae bacterium]